ncbi:hypothetical protein [Murinocardiopsis flavida]|uniref:hypothetical protein n=1 Tax=Murinocardiopsis flavida TaxID=645275 RepID=UPI001FE6E059|nr:hypothetical protein [Murinocardiopsis flavida]
MTSTGRRCGSAAEAWVLGRNAADDAVSPHGSTSRYNSKVRHPGRPTVALIQSTA